MKRRKRQGTSKSVRQPASPQLNPPVDAPNGDLAAERAALVLSLEQMSAAYQNELRLRYATRELTAAILDNCPLAEVAESVTALIAQMLRVERVALFLRDETTLMRPMHLREIPLDCAELMARTALRDPQMTAAAPFQIKSLRNESALTAEHCGILTRENADSLLIAPLNYTERVRGLLVVIPQPGRDFSPEELAIFQSFATMATLGVALSRQIEQQKAVSQIEERNRLAREMHDTVAQALIALSMQLETAQTYLATHRADEARELLGQSRHLAKEALNETRRAVQNLGSSLLERLTPAEAIAAEAARFEAEKKIAAPFVLSGEERPLSPDQQAALLRITQECLANAGRHAQANRVRVGLQFSENDVLLRVEDDGIGFEVENRAAPGPAGGYGLFGATERARLLGGEVKIESALGWGTRILARLPLGREQGTQEGLRAEGRGMRQESVNAEVLPQPSALSPQPSPNRIRVLIADDHAVTRQGIRTMLESSAEIEVIGEAQDGAEAETLTLELRPDVVLMDVQMPNVDGIEATRRLRAARPDLPIVILTTFQTDDSVRDSLRAGARGYLLKTAAAADLVAAVKAAKHGETMLAASVSDRLAILAQGHALDMGDTLNERALEVLHLLAKGARNKEIAAQLFISERTVEYHLSNIFLKLGVTNRTEAARAAVARGIIAG